MPVFIGQQFMTEKLLNTPICAKSVKPFRLYRGAGAYRKTTFQEDFFPNPREVEEDPNV
jgi:hypothetical protein